MPSAPDQPRIIHHRPIEELADSLQNSWKSVCECTARFLREVYEFDLRQGYKEWGYMDTARSADALVLMARRSLSGRFRGIAGIIRQRAPGDGARGRVRAVRQGGCFGPSH